MGAINPALNSGRGSLTPMKRCFEATFSCPVEAASEPSSKEGYVDENTGCSASTDDEEDEEDDDDASSDEDDDESSVEEILPKDKFCGPNLDEESWGRWVTVYGFKSWEVDVVLCGLKSTGVILKHVQGLDDANWMHILYKKHCDAQEAIRKSWVKVKGNLVVGMKPLDAIERQTLNEGLNKQNVDPSRPVPGRKSPTRPVYRMRRALHEGLRLLHRVEADFFILGSTGRVYNVRLSKTPSCNCPDCTIPCKHILFVLLQVLGIPHNDHCLYRKILRPYHLTRLLNMATSPETLAGARARNQFQHLFSISEVGPPPPVIELGSGATCPICSEKLTKLDNEEAVDSEIGMDEEGSEEFTSEDEVANEEGFAGENGMDDEDSHEFTGENKLANEEEADGKNGIDDEGSQEFTSENELAIEEGVDGENGMDEGSEEPTSEDNEGEVHGEKGMKNADEVDSEDMDSEDEPYRESELVRCWTCESVGHTECLVIWSKGRGLSGPTCRNCKRDWWMHNPKLSMYPNLAAYLDKD